MNLNEADVYTLIGDAGYRQSQGEEDMPDYLLDLAARIAETIGRKALAERAKEIQKGFQQALGKST